MSQKVFDKEKNSSLSYRPASFENTKMIVFYSAKFSDENGAGKLSNILS